MQSSVTGISRSPAGDCAGFTLGGVLTGLAVGAAILVFCVPAIGSRLQRRAQSALAAVHRVEATLAAAADEFSLPARARPFSAPPPTAAFTEPDPANDVTDDAIQDDVVGWPAPWPRLLPVGGPWPGAPSRCWPVPLRRPGRRLWLPPYRPPWRIR
jgi:hypothetical protein